MSIFIHEYLRNNIMCGAFFTIQIDSIPSIIMLSAVTFNRFIRW